jgi:hypothetical protein
MQLALCEVAGTFMFDPPEDRFCLLDDFIGPHFCEGRFRVGD